MDAIIQSGSVLPMVKQMLRISNSDHDIFLDGLLLQATRRLSTNETLTIKNCTVTVKSDSRFYMPKDAKRIVAFRGSDSCVPGFFVDIDFFGQCGCTLDSSFSSIVSVVNIQGRWGYLVMAVPDDTEFEVAYQAINTDADGMPVINEEMELALINYACWRFALSYKENYDRDQIAEWKSDYMFQAGKCRGLAARRKFEQARDQIQMKINQMVNTSIPFSSLAGTYYSFIYPTIR